MFYPFFSFYQFRAWARAEADRYGPDRWVFVRELLQNARDAGATAVAFTARVEAGRWRLHCRDHGEGMSYDHARCYLFALYASSKEQRRDQVGRFGVGFWSILRFEPTRITIRSRPRMSAETGRSGQGPSDSWELELTGDLESAVQRVPDMGGPGTEVVLERPGPDAELERRVFEAAWQNARFLATFQLPPTVKSKLAEAGGLKETLFERCMQLENSSVLLDVQYRMHEHIMNFSNQQFYGEI